MRIVVHGGAGSRPEDPNVRQAVLQEAANTGAAEREPLDAVEASLTVLEESPLFNAGRGGAVQADGVVRLDAGVMTDRREVGGVCSMSGVVRATSVARTVLERTPHILVSGHSAVRLAEDTGVEVNIELLTDETRQRYTEADPPAGNGDALRDWVEQHFGRAEGCAADDHDTVGAVAVSDQGTLASATSTGGRWFAWPGRVGDTPQIGAGFFAAPAGGASATGWGEDIARVALCREAVDRLETGKSPSEAANSAVATLEGLTGGDAGIIVVDRAGRVGTAWNTETMQTATAQV